MSLSRHRYSRVTGIPCAMVLTDSSVLSPVIGLVCHRHRRDAKASLPTWHQRRDARTTRLRRPRSAHSSRAPSRPSHPTPNVRDDREAPLERARDQVGLLLFLPKRKAKYFCKQDWTDSISLIQLNYLRGRRSGFAFAGCPGPDHMRAFAKVKRPCFNTLDFEAGSGVRAPSCDCYSITSSAPSKMEVGIDRPSNFAVRPLTINSWAVGSSMGMSPGLAPFRILSMKYPYRLT